LRRVFEEEVAAASSSAPEEKGVDDSSDDVGPFAASRLIQHRVDDSRFPMCSEEMSQK
jgi:hypothetical protein